MEISTLVAVFFTMAIFSFLYRDNPFYRLAEHVLIGLSVGFTLVLLFNSVLLPKLFQPLFGSHDLWSLIPLALGLSMFAGLKKSWGSYSKPALALMIGSGAGVSIPAMMEARVLRQMASAIEPFSRMGAGESVGLWFIVTILISLIGVATVMIYFFYTRPETKPVTFVSQVGIYFLMVFFGATFGYTVTSRLTLLIGRLEFLLGDFLGLI
ncbi:MAG: hypothetical protein KAT58_05200 [candidate division Zixibacteria bacterium]|nr:hypothetical protein [candidate division Zixibacteria bacterium]